MRGKPYEKRRSESLVNSPTTSKEFCNDLLFLNNLLYVSSLSVYSAENASLCLNETPPFNIFDYVDPEPPTIHGPSNITVNCLQEVSVPGSGIKEENYQTTIASATAASENIASDLENINIDIKTEEDASGADMEHDDTSRTN